MTIAVLTINSNVTKLKFNDGSQWNVEDTSPERNVKDTVLARSPKCQGTRVSHYIVLIRKDPQIRNVTALRDPSTNNRNTGE